MTLTRITQLAQRIAAKTAIVNDYFELHGFPTPSFDIHGPQRIAIPPQVTEVASAHGEVLEATKELYDLMLGPSSVLMETIVRDLRL